MFATLQPGSRQTISIASDVMLGISSMVVEYLHDHGTSTLCARTDRWRCAMRILSVFVLSSVISGCGGIQQVNNVVVGPNSHVDKVDFRQDHIN